MTDTFVPPIVITDKDTAWTVYIALAHQTARYGELLTKAVRTSASDQKVQYLSEQCKRCNQLTHEVFNQYAALSTPGID